MEKYRETVTITYNAARDAVRVAMEQAAAAGVFPL